MSSIQPLSPSSPEYKAISSFNIIYEAGLDGDSRPVLVLSACHLPDPATINYDLILADEFVENDYVLVFFSAPATFRPPWLWLLKAYRALDRKYKKNLKALYVVHLVRSYRMIFDLANKITSPKFARKLHYYSTLQELYGAIQLSSQFIPQQVIQYDNQLPPVAPPRRTSVPATPARPLPSLAYGLSLEALAKQEDCEGDAAYVPSLVLRLTDHLRSHGLDKEGLFRKSPSSDELHYVKEALNRGEHVDLTRYGVDLTASLLKIFFMELPEPLISTQLCTDLGKLPDALACSPEEMQAIRDKLQEAYADKPLSRNLLRHLMSFLREVVEHVDQNRMNVHNLAVVFTPSLVREASAKVDSKAPSTQEAAMAAAAVYMKQMNEGMALTQFLISAGEQLFL
ncbi:Rho GTPase activation protein [Syncephalastrum racemosum]|uniref:Rho GTPase activation protein n=1 Tax=Syncephalastrum racemosum TaxID=13706 RepID=A0A1X2H6C9_SYNRA|nr:Rho GTPase activation protein [Syncephalastrum racemosum]